MKFLPSHCKYWVLALVAFAGLVPLPRLHAGVPDWLRALASAPLPTYSEETNAVVLLDEKAITVEDNGDFRETFRKAYKILRPNGRSHGVVAVPFDKDTKILSLTGWSITSKGEEYEVKQKDASEVAAYESWILYADDRGKVLRIPAADPGNVVGYEYSVRTHPPILEESWDFQSELPVRTARLSVQLPPGWEYTATWANSPEQQSQSSGTNAWEWEMHDIAAVENEPDMPAHEAVEGRMHIHFKPSSAALRDRALGSWRDVGVWYTKLAESRHQPTPELHNKVLELTADKKTTLDKIDALATFVQKDIRYVAIYLGIGGFQPHAAGDIFTQRYGDCKDKATLLMTMLHEIGVDSYYVLINVDRGVVSRDDPSPEVFDHAIVAIRLPADVQTQSLFAADKTSHGTLLFFDPTDELIPLGSLPEYLQANYGLLVTETGGELVRLPMLPPATNRLLRQARLKLTPDGTLYGDVQEILWGATAAERRHRMLNVTEEQRVKAIEEFLGTFLSGFQLVKPQITDDGNTLSLSYGFIARGYASTAGDLLLVRPRVLGQKSSSILEQKPRKYPVAFSCPMLQTDDFEIVLPPGYTVDELPPPADVKFDFARYHSDIKADGNVLKYVRQYQINDVLVDKDHFDQLKQFYRTIATDENGSAVLKRIASQ